jgi:hypothetical protein
MKHFHWNKRGGGAKVAESINVEVGIFLLVHNCNKQGVEGGKKILKINKRGGWKCTWRVVFF